MGKIAPILMIGFGLFITGFYYHLWHDSITFINDYIINDEYYALIRLGWDMIPVVLIMVGIIWLIKQGVSGRGQRVVYE